MHFYKKPADRKRYENQKIPYKIEPFENELLSSYMARVAYTFSCSPTSFYYLYFPEYFKNKILFRRDMDIWADEIFLRKLSEKTRVCFDKLWQTSLRFYEGYLFEKCTVNSVTFMIDGLGLRGSICKGYGYKICPQCLKEDKSPYLRKIWRVSFYSACVKHGTFLWDECPQCKASINPYKLTKNELLFGCYKCGLDYKQFPLRMIPENSYGLMTIKTLTQVLNDGYFKLSGNDYTYSLNFFVVVRQLMNVVRYLVRHGKISDWEILNHEILFNSEYYAKVNKNLFMKREIEKMRVLEKYFLFSMVMGLFIDYPYLLKKFIIKHSIYRSLLIKDFYDGKRIPFFYIRAIEILEL